MEACIRGLRYPLKCCWISVRMTVEESWQNRKLERSTFATLAFATA